MKQSNSMVYMSKPRTKALFNLLVVFFILFTTSINAQDVFRTTNGKIQLTGVWNDSVLTVRSDELIIIMNYETAAFHLKLDKSTLKTGIDSLDARLKKLERNYIEYEGKLGIDYIITHDHPPLDFIVEGYLNCFPHNEHIVGKGRLEHIFQGYYSCILNMTFHISLKEINMEINLPGLKDEIHVEILQSVLNQEN